jgi:hypothetical protein
MNNTHTIITKGFATAAGEGERDLVRRRYVDAQGDRCKHR